jgi:hypothetical protein
MRRDEAAGPVLTVSIELRNLPNYFGSLKDLSSPISPIIADGAASRRASSLATKSVQSTGSGNRSCKSGGTVPKRLS